MSLYITFISPNSRYKLYDLKFYNVNCIRLNVQVQITQFVLKIRSVLNAIQFVNIFVLFRTLYKGTTNGFTILQNLLKLCNKIFVVLSLSRFFESSCVNLNISFCKSNVCKITRNNSNLTKKKMYQRGFLNNHQPN